MGEFEEYIKVNYPRDYERQKRIYPDQSIEELYSEDYKMWQHQQAIIDEHTEVIKLQDADLQKYEKQIENLKEQLNNMEACYIEKKKQVEELQGQIDASKSSQPKLHKTEIGDCLHFSTTMFHDGKAICFDCDAVVNHKREVIGVMQTKALRGGHE